MTTRNGPTLAIAGDCAECDRHFVTDYSPTVRQCLAGAVPVTLTTPDTPADCPRLSAARLALLADLARTVCRRCGAIVEPERECYAVPTCFACLPPPPPLPVRPLPP